MARQWLKIRRGGYRQISHVLRRAYIETANETVALVKDKGAGGHRQTH